MRRIISILVLMSFIFTTTSVHAAKICFSNMSTMKKFTTDLKDYNVNLPIAQKDLVLCNQEIDILKNKEKLNLTMIVDLKKDKVLLDKEYKKAQDDFINTNSKLKECEDNKPSRLTWFGVGFASALILGIIGAFALK